MTRHRPQCRCGNRQTVGTVVCRFHAAKSAIFIGLCWKGAPSAMHYIDNVARLARLREHQPDRSSGALAGATREPIFSG
jgi:hypothetical protein